MDLSPAGRGRAAISLGILGLLALSVLWTMEPGKYRTLVWILLGFFAARIALQSLRSR